MTEPSPTVFVVDDDEAVRNAIRMLISSEGLEADTYPSAEAFLKGYNDASPGCLILDVRMGEMSGLELQNVLKERGIGLPVIIITGHGDVPMAVQAVKNGALDFIQKPFDDQVLLDRIQQALRIDAERRRHAARRRQLAARLDKLTPREREVMDLLLTGMGNKEIALQLGLSRKTVDIHRGHVMLKLGVDSLADLLRLGLALQDNPRPDPRSEGTA